MIPLIKWIKSKIKYQKEIRRQPEIEEQFISATLSDNVSFLTKLYQESSDIVFRSFSIGKNQDVEAFFVAVDGLFDKTMVNEHVLKPLMSLSLQEGNESDLLKHIENTVINISSIKKESSMKKSTAQLMKGDSLLFINGLNEALVLGVRAWESRGIEEPVTETTVRGPREGFVETLRINTSMLRRRIHHPKLQITQMVVGEVTQTEVAIAYIDDIVSPGIVEEVKKRLQRIRIDAVLESGYIEAFIEDVPFSIFPTVANTERPDVVAARLLEGRVAIFVEGSTTVLVIPHLMFESFQSSEDYYSRPYYATIIRLLRLAGFLVTTLSPGAYVAFQDFHKEIFPTELLISIAASREGVPFPLAIEVLLMLITFEWLREAGVRMPRPVGQAVSIVGALVIGEAAVNAGLVGAPTVIVIAVSAITGFLVTGLADVAAILRFLYLFAAGTFGLYGMILIVAALMLHVASLRSFGIPYMSPLFPITWSGWKDLFIRTPLWALNRRPEVLNTVNEIRQAEGQRPHPPKNYEND
ncbi:spore germination protein [Paenibacillus naphthalenovorans]|uniref:Spore gernimation protein GerA n=1 Tax=Paenibacillus naphthalenovorans TaxID=162209 RepID=A0A0U2UPX8_9BACL|nr:spore germination protein [Paenibacillus naphthalenovorans]ALS25084.1 spore gernimation protein GerA [Paenibacillus naphthalenovorans]SDI36399.1 spore germination protein KA [Paenibacillus naphthalenovorans]